MRESPASRRDWTVAIVLCRSPRVVEIALFESCHSLRVTNFDFVMASAHVIRKAIPVRIPTTFSIVKWTITSLPANCQVSGLILKPPFREPLEESIHCSSA